MSTYLRVGLSRPSTLRSILETTTDFDENMGLRLSSSGLKIQMYNSSEPTCMLYIQVARQFFDDHNFWEPFRTQEVGVNVESLLKILSLCAEDPINITFTPDYVVFAALHGNPEVHYDVRTIKQDFEYFTMPIDAGNRRVFDYVCTMIIPSREFGRILNCGKLVLFSCNTCLSPGEPSVQFSSSNGPIRTYLKYSHNRADVIIVVTNNLSFTVNFLPFSKSLSKAIQLSTRVKLVATRTFLSLTFELRNTTGSSIDYFFSPQDVDIRSVFCSE